MFTIPTTSDELPNGWTPQYANQIIHKSIRNLELTDEEYEWLKSIAPPQVNQCGDCSMCCSAPAIEENVIDGKILTQPKEACKACDKLFNGKCSVYNNRPDVCRSYLCAYAMGSTDVSPLESKVAWSFQTNEEGMPILIGHTHSVEEVFSIEKNIQMIQEVCDTGEIFAVTVRDSRIAICIECSTFNTQMAFIDQTDPIKSKLIFESIRTLGRGIPFIQK